jgi:hypothetical protein
MDFISALHVNVPECALLDVHTIVASVLVGCGGRFKFYADKAKVRVWFTQTSFVVHITTIICKQYKVVFWQADGFLRSTVKVWTTRPILCVEIGPYEVRKIRFCVQIGLKIIFLFCIFFRAQERLQVDCIET